MAQRMGSDMFVNFCDAGCLANGFLQDGFIEVVTADNTSACVPGKVRRREKILPDPFPAGGGVFVFKSHRQIDGAEAILEVFLVHEPYLLKVKLERLNKDVRKNREAVIFTFSI